MQRKEFLRSLGMAGLVLPILSRCKSQDDPSPGSTGSDNSSNGGDPTAEDNTSADSCSTTASETAGPFPTKDPASLERIDICGDRTGIAMEINITILDSSNSCAPLEGAIVDIWHCDKDGNYSEYGGTQMQNTNYSSVHFLRGRQVSNSNGMVAFTSIFPGWYNGRSTHIHVHIYNSTGKSLLVTQIAFPEGDDSAVVAVNASSENGYTKGMSGYTYNGNDNVFSDGVATELSSISGSVSDGFTLSHSIVVTP